MEWSGVGSVGRVAFAFFGRVNEHKREGMEERDVANERRDWTWAMQQRRMLLGVLGIWKL